MSKQVPAGAPGADQARPPISILGSTGSIGTQALDMLGAQGRHDQVWALAAGGNVELLARQVREFSPQVVALADGNKEEELRQALADYLREHQVEIICGADAAREVSAASGQGIVLNGITGAAGLQPTVAALQSGARLALANKESLVIGGPAVLAAQRYPGQVTPVDSEHSAIAQALASGIHRRGMTAGEVDGYSELAAIILTASGGPFRGWTRAELADVSAAQALAHPTWDMGPMVTINSSTLMNKGLEVIEAALLFDVAPEQIIAVVHPQSIIHSGVTWRDGSSVLQASPPDMRLPIALGLSFPERWPQVTQPCDWSQASSWTFEPVDNETFPALEIARQALASGPGYPCVMNAANEVAVAAFIEGRVGYLAIIDTVQRCLEAFASSRLADQAWDVAQAMDVDRWARAQATAFMSAGE